jgi:adenine-specific DNA-methyltransferase
MPLSSGALGDDPCSCAIHPPCRHLRADVELDGDLGIGLAGEGSTSCCCDRDEQFGAEQVGFPLLVPVRGIAAAFSGVAGEQDAVELVFEQEMREFMGDVRPASLGCVGCVLHDELTTSGATAEFLPGTSDYVLWYGKHRDQLKFNRLFETKTLGGIGGGEYRREMSADGVIASAGTLPDARPFRLDNLTSPRVRENRTGYYPVEVDGRTFLPGAGEWKTHPAGMRRLIAAGRIVARANSLSYLRFIDDFPAVAINTIWADTGVAGRPGDKVYVVQTSPKIIERCMLMSTDPGDLVIDPTCGAGTTAYVAEQWGRRWITIDTSRVAIALARQRIIGARYPAYLLADSSEGRAKERELSGAEPPTTAPMCDVRKGLVYERVPHVTLKSIANNPDIVEAMSRKAIDAAIMRHAESEILYDRPYEDRRKIRVAGRFTVESLSPHRATTFEISEDQPANGDSDAYLKTVLDNLIKAGVQNGWRSQRLEFGSLTPYPGRLLNAEGVRRNGGDGSPLRIAVSVGPQYGTVDADWIKDAAREALRGLGFDLLLVCGFSFDAHASSVVGEFKPEGDDFATVAAQRQIGRLPILLVRMNADLAMGDTLLKKTGTANLFTVFGEPDITIETTSNGLVVEIRGVDVYNPTTGELRSGGTEDVAMWMIDTAYDDDEFLVRHIYFAGTEGKPDALDPYARLRRALRADVDEAAWATLYATRSRPFPRPDSGKIAIKVINHYGDEVLKTYEV